MASKTLGGAGGVLPLPEKALGEAMEKGGRKMQDLYGQEPCYYGESLVVTGESMSQLGDMRWAVWAVLTIRQLGTSSTGLNGSY